MSPDAIGYHVLRFRQDWDVQIAEPLGCRYEMMHAPCLHHFEQDSNEAVPQTIRAAARKRDYVAQKT